MAAVSLGRNAATAEAQPPGGVFRGHPTTGSDAAGWQSQRPKLRAEPLETDARRVAEEEKRRRGSKGVPSAEALGLPGEKRKWNARSR
jgi:hypothetical protein